MALSKDEQVRRWGKLVSEMTTEEFAAALRGELRGKPWRLAPETGSIPDDQVVTATVMMPPPSDAHSALSGDEEVPEQE